MKSIRLAWVPTLTLLTVLVIPGQFAGVRKIKIANASTIITNSSTWARSMGR